MDKQGDSSLWQNLDLEVYGKGLQIGNLLEIRLPGVWKVMKLKLEVETSRHILSHIKIVG